MDPKIEDQKPIQPMPGIARERDLGVQESQPGLELPTELKDAGLEAHEESDNVPFKINTNQASQIPPAPSTPAAGLEGYSLDQVKEQAKGDPRNGIVGRSMVAVRQLTIKFFNRKSF